MNRITVHQTGEYGESARAGWFDAERATRYAEDTEFDGSNHISVNTGSQWHHEELFRTAGGRWVLGSYSNYQGTLPSYHFVGDDAAREWLIYNDEDDAAEEHFGQIEDESGPDVGGRPEIGPAINVRLDPKQLERVDALSDELDTSRAALIRLATERLTSHQLAVYRLAGAVEVLTLGTETEGTSRVDLGFHDADGAEWRDDLDALLTRHGYRRIGEWSLAGHDSVAPVEDVPL